MLNRVIGVFLLVYYNQKQQQLTRRANLPRSKKCVTSPSLVPFTRPPPPRGASSNGRLAFILKKWLYRTSGIGQAWLGIDKP